MALPAKLIFTRSIELTKVITPIGTLSRSMSLRSADWRSPAAWLSSRLGNAKTQ
jgi:hypothetical protein